MDMTEREHWLVGRLEAAQHLHDDLAALAARVRSATAQVRDLGVSGTSTLGEIVSEWFTGEQVKMRDRAAQCFTLTGLPEAPEDKEGEHADES